MLSSLPPKAVRACPRICPRADVSQGLLSKHEAPEDCPPGLISSTRWMVGTGGLEPPTSCVSSKRSPPELRPSVPPTALTNTGGEKNLSPTPPQCQGKYGAEAPGGKGAGVTFPPLPL